MLLRNGYDEALAKAQHYLKHSRADGEGWRARGAICSVEGMKLSGNDGCLRWFVPHLINSWAGKYGQPKLDLAVPFVRGMVSMVEREYGLVPGGQLEGEVKKISEELTGLV
ncbi:hypothetical protein M427DRAFT_134826 [Gonapodya prolifera JEL478]|uniref:Uncharacterized protein n=1 Tax=Gonapodya prolifera (strain JEL478) TaxID=1344416 RepID=A0A139AG40_GONPJ|nr:hypothetical protein M427DRAFT_134826 [Gonapodya prolifera JEL478]|eukprot:KXS15792.1 hypothetical protein M427DRAFT_134826 [Gonapodya prolifera JEL478]